MPDAAALAAVRTLLATRHATSHDPLDGVYVLGVNEPVKTVLSQQRRALNLAEALVECGQVGPGSRVAVIGGGISGVTFAAATARRGAAVTVFEQRTRVMGVQGGTHGRWLHPHVAEWPTSGWALEKARLPLLDWSEDWAADVVIHLANQWERLATHFEIRQELGATNVTLCEGSAGPWTITWNGRGFQPPAEFDVVVFAVGFGQEASGKHAQSYWHNDDLDRDPESHGRTLVTGCGDGGLIDYVRSAYVVGDWPAVYKALMEPSMLDVGAAVAAAEGDTSVSPSALTAFYLELETPALDAVLAPLRRNTEVWLNSPHDVPFRRGVASPLNKLLASRVMRAGGSYRAGRVTTEPTDAEQVAVTFTTAAGTETVEVFNQVVSRHGPHGDPLAGFPFVEALATADDFARFDLLDRTRHPGWDDQAMRWNPPGGGVGAGPGGVDPSGVGPTGTPAPPTVGWGSVSALQFAGPGDGRDTVRAYLEGGNPTWGVVTSGLVRERSMVAELTADLLAQVAPGARSGVTWLSGAAGEGKSTVLLQTVRNLAVSPDAPESLEILWRETGSLPIDRLRTLADDRPVLLVADDAGDLVRAITRLSGRSWFRQALERRTAPIRFLLSANDAAATLDRTTLTKWRRLFECDLYALRGLTPRDAELIVEAFEEHDDGSLLGQLAELTDRRDRVQRLLENAEGGSVDSSLLGGLLRSRMGTTLTEHVASLLDVLRSVPLPGDYSAEELYLFAGALQFQRLGTVSTTVLSDAMDVPINTLTTAMLPVIESELAVTPEGVQIRHAAIAECVWDLALGDGERRRVLASAYEELVASTVRLFPRGWSDQQLHDVIYVSMRLKEVAPDLARAAAYGATAGAPRNGFFLTTLAATYRETSPDRSGAQEGAEVLAYAFRHRLDLDEESRRDMSAMLIEWAVCVGFRGEGVGAAAGNLCLGVLALSDRFFPEPRPIDSISRCLAVVGRGVMDLMDRGSPEPVESTLAAVVTLLDVTQPSGAVARHHRRFRELLPEGSLVHDVESALAELAGRYRSAWEWCDADLRAQLEAYHPPVQLTQVRRALSEVRAKRVG